MSIRKAGMTRVDYLPSGLGSMAFGGRPRQETLRMASKSSAVYKASIQPCFSGSGFFGLPGGGTVRIASTADGSYTPVCPIIFTGFIPFFCSLLFVAVCVMPKTSDISLMVISSMLLLSEYIAENKKSIGTALFSLDKQVQYRYSYYIGQ